MMLLSNYLLPRGTLLGPLLFFLYINDIMVDMDSEIPLIADDSVSYRQIHSIEDTVKLQRDINRLGRCARKWGMRFQPTKCNMMQLTRKGVKKVIATYTLEGTVLENVDRIKYLGVTITKDLRWNIHVGNICTKADRTLGFLRRNISSCPRHVKEMAYKGLVRPVLKYASPVWDPRGKTLQDELEKVQNRAARFVTRNYNFETGSMTKILEQSKWKSLKQRRKGSRLILFYKCLKGQASIPVDDLYTPLRHARDNHSEPFQVQYARTDDYRYSFFPETIRDWKALTASTVSSAECSEECVSRLTSLMRSRE